MSDDQRQRLEEILKPLAELIPPAEYEFTLLGLGLPPGSHALLYLEQPRPVLERYLAWVQESRQAGQWRDSDLFFELVPAFVRRLVLCFGEQRHTLEVHAAEDARKARELLGFEALVRLVVIAVQRSAERNETIQAAGEHFLLTRRLPTGRD